MTPEERKSELLELLRVALAVLPPDPKRSADKITLDVVTIYRHAKALPADVIPRNVKLHFLVQDIVYYFRPRQKHIGPCKSWFSDWMEEQDRADRESLELDDADE